MTTHGGQMDQVTKWPSDRVTKWQEASQTIDRMVYLFEIFKILIFVTNYIIRSNNKNSLSLTLNICNCNTTILIFEFILYVQLHWPP